MNRFPLYRRLLSYAKPHWSIFTVSIVCMIAIAATEPLFAELLKRLWAGFDHPKTSGVRWIPIIIVGLFLFRGILSFGTAYTLAWTSNRVITDIRRQLFDRLLALPTAYHDTHSSGRLISRIANDVGGIAQAVSNALTSLIKDSITVLALLAYLVYLNWQMTLLALIVVPVVVTIVSKFSRRLRRSASRAQETLGELVHVLEEAVGCQKIIKIFGGQAAERARFDQRNRALRSQAMKQAIASAAITPSTQIFISIAMSLVVYFALYESAAGRLTIESFVAFLTAMILLLSPLKSLADVSAPIQRGLAAAESVFELLDEPPEVDEGTQTLTEVKGELCFRQVCFTYPCGEALALDHVDFVAKPGQRVALVGSSGSGKTTTANLIPRFYSPTSGQITLDGLDIAQFELANLRSHIAIVSQDVVLFDDSVANNIAYGTSAGASRDEIILAAKSANAWDFICEMPDGLDTKIGERGLRLSGGQRQRIAIARALLKDAPILILDEATSALDTASERKVQTALDRLMTHRTTIVIAHRLSTIENADLVIVLQQGKIVETGTHLSLLEKQGVYANLHRLQFSEEGTS